MDIDGEFHEDSTIKAWLEAEPNGELLLGNSDQECSQSLAYYPVTVSAFLDGEVREMTKISSNKWSEVEWPNQPSTINQSRIN